MNAKNHREELLAELRARMVVEQIERPVKDDRPPVKDERVLAAMRMVPRHAFLLEGYEKQAYEDRPQPIGNGQTISQPYIVAVMTELLDPQPGDVVLEVGTGSGYQAAVLSGLVREVVSVEAVPELAASAQERLEELGYHNVRVVIGDGAAGWRPMCPYDGIIVTAAGPSVPEALLTQLMPGGRLVIPVGATPNAQQLLVLEKRPDGTITRRSVMPVRFVPLVAAGAERLWEGE